VDSHLYTENLNKKFLERYTKALVKHAKYTSTFEVSKYTNEINLIMESLISRQKNCPLLVSKHTLIKNKIVEMFAMRIAKQNIPFLFVDLEILKIDLKSIVALDQDIFHYFWFKNKYIFKYIFNISKIIIYFENLNELYLLPKIYNFIFYNQDILRIHEQPYEIFQNAFKEHSFKCIATVTPKRLINLIWMKKLSIRFQKIYIKNINLIENYIIIKKYISLLENYHNIKFEENVIFETIQLTIKHLNQTNYTNIVIEILDRIGSIEQLKNISNNEILYKFIKNEQKNIDSFIFNIFTKFNIKSEHLLFQIKKFYNELLLKWINNIEKKKTKNNTPFFFNYEQKFFISTFLLKNINIDFFFKIFKNIILIFRRISKKSNNLYNLLNIYLNLNKKNLKIRDLFITNIIPLNYIYIYFKLYAINYDIYKYSIIKSLHKILIQNLFLYFFYNNKNNFIPKIYNIIKIFSVKNIINFYTIGFLLIYYILENNKRKEETNNFILFFKKFKKCSLIYNFNKYIYNYYKLIKKIFLKKYSNDIIIDFDIKTLQIIKCNLKHYIYKSSYKIYNTYKKIKKNLMLMLTKKTDNKNFKKIKKKFLTNNKNKKMGISNNIYNNIRISNDYIKFFFSNFTLTVEGYKLPKNQYPNLENLIKNQIAGQQLIIHLLCRAIRRALYNIRDAQKPIVSYIFCGPTGVGKTEICKVLATILYGDKDNLVRFDMSEFMEHHSVSRLIGTPPGYIGFGGGQLTSAVKKNPNCFLLFDEFEKASKNIQKIFLQILDDGRLSDNSTYETISFKDTIIVLTSNIGSDKIRETFENEGNFYEDKSNIKMSEFEKQEYNTYAQYKKIEKEYIKNIEEKKKKENIKNDINKKNEEIFYNTYVKNRRPRGLVEYLEREKKFKRDKIENEKIEKEEIEIRKIEIEKIKKENDQYIEFIDNTRLLFDNLLTTYIDMINQYNNYKYMEPYNLMPGFKKIFPIKMDVTPYEFFSYIQWYVREQLRTQFIEIFKMYKNNNTKVKKITLKQIFLKETIVATETYEKIQTKIIKVIKKEYSPEFVNRLDDIVIFEPMTYNALEKVYDILIKNFVKKLSKNNIALTVADDIKEPILHKGYDPQFGARPLKRAITTILENLIVEGLMNVSIPDDQKKIIGIYKNADGVFYLTICDKITKKDIFNNSQKNLNFLKNYKNENENIYRENINKIKNYITNNFVHFENIQKNKYYYFNINKNKILKSTIESSIKIIMPK
jgi:ATP-dependent Clp protease ATP-binding subunit ClpA